MSRVLLTRTGTCAPTTELDLEEVRLDAHDGHQSDPGRDGEEAAGDA